MVSNRFYNRSIPWLWTTISMQKKTFPEKVLEQTTTSRIPLRIPYGIPSSIPLGISPDIPPGILSEVVPEFNGTFSLVFLQVFLSEFLQGSSQILHPGFLHRFLTSIGEFPLQLFWDSIIDTLWDIFLYSYRDSFIDFFCVAFTNYFQDHIRDSSRILSSEHPSGIPPKKFFDFFFRNFFLDSLKDSLRDSFIGFSSESFVDFPEIPLGISPEIPSAFFQKLFLRFH